MPSLEANDTAFLQAAGKQDFTKPPRILIIGAGSRGTAYAEAVSSSSNAVVAAVCEPNDFKRADFGRKFMWGPDGEDKPGESFKSWSDWKEYEIQRRQQEKGGDATTEGIDAAFICVLDEMHEEVVCGIADMGLHICCEKPMSTRLESCMRMYRALQNGGKDQKEAIFGIGHVLRYSPHNMMLRHLLLKKDVIGDVMSIEHVEPIGWWHFSHSYVRYAASILVKLHS